MDAKLEILEEGRSSCMGRYEEKEARQLSFSFRKP
jgi:hypothetical protein